MQTLVKKLGAESGEKGKQKQEVAARTGSKMLDQLQPWYFAVAFAFCFRSCIAYPNLDNRKRYRRPESAVAVVAFDNGGSSGSDTLW